MVAWMESLNISNDGPLFHCIFTCSTAELLDEGCFTDLVARQLGVGAAVTGLVVYEAGNAFQVLEGPKEQLDKLYQAACLDSSFRKVVKIVEEPIADRDFDGISSAYGLSSKDRIPGQRNITYHFNESDEFGRVCGGRAQRLVRDFTLGKWRLRAVS